MIHINRGISIDRNAVVDEMIAPGIGDGKRFGEFKHRSAALFRRYRRYLFAVGWRIAFVLCRLHEAAHHHDEPRGKGCVPSIVQSGHCSVEIGKMPA